MIMKKFLFLLIASLLLGFVFFAAMYWLFDCTWNDSFSMALTVALSGLITEYVRENLKKRTKNKQIN